MKYSPDTGEERPYPSNAKQWREYHGKVAWLYNPWTGEKRDPRDVGSDVYGEQLYDGVSDKVTVFQKQGKHWEIISVADFVEKLKEMEDNLPEWNFRPDTSLAPCTHKMTHVDNVLRGNLPLADYLFPNTLHRSWKELTVSQRELLADNLEHVEHFRDGEWRKKTGSCFHQDSIYRVMEPGKEAKPLNTAIVYVGGDTISKERWEKYFRPTEEEPDQGPSFSDLLHRFVPRQLPKDYWSAQKF